MQKFKTFFSQFRARDFVMLTLAGIINATGVTMFLAPLRLFDSGLSGTAYLFNQLTPDWLGLWFFLLVLNFPFYLFGLKKMGAKFVCCSLYAIGIYSLFSFLYQSVFPIDWSAGSPIVQEDKLLAAIFGGLISGIGSGMTIRYGGAIDGVEVMAVMFAKKIGMTVGTFIMAYNVLLYSVSAIIFKSWDIPLYSVLAYAVGLKAVDFIVDGLDKGKAAWIVSSEHEKIAAELSKELIRGITVLEATGYYSGENRKILYVVVNRFEIAKLKSIVKSIDHKAFVAIYEISDTMGVNVRFKQNNYDTQKSGGVGAKLKGLFVPKRHAKPVDEAVAEPADAPSDAALVPPLRPRCVRRRRASPFKRSESRPIRERTKRKMRKSSTRTRKKNDACGVVNKGGKTMKEIASATNETFKRIKSLKTKAARKQLGLMLAEGERTVADLPDECAVRMLVLAKSQADRFAHLAESKGAAETIVVPDKLFESLSDTVTPSGVIAVVATPPPARVTAADCVVLDGVSDPGNFGTIVRTCAACGIEQIVAVGCTDFTSPKVVRASMGCVFRTRIAE